MVALINPFHGRINRLQWWMYQLVILVFTAIGFVCIGLYFADSHGPDFKLSDDEIVALVLLIFLNLNMNFSTCINRLRDTGRSGFWYIAFLGPTFGTALMIYFCGIEPGKKDPPVPAATNPNVQMIT
ncbi:DUF805 domain-containing protein [Roseibium sp.]